MGKRKTGRNVHGILLLDKRQGISSNQALQEVKHLFDANKAGHTGSLDPLATGLLPICFGEATKVSGWMLDDDKRYRVDVQLGVTTVTGDLEGAVIERRSVPEISPEQLQACLTEFTGAIDQVPPMYSALKQQGKKLYELARAGQTVERPARRIRIYRLVLLDRSADRLTLDVSCSKGTYIRSLAEDIGRYFGCGATVAELRRLESGIFRLDQACTVDALRAMTEAERINRLIDVDWPLQALPLARLSEQEAKTLRFGQAIVKDQLPQGQVRLYHETVFLGLGEMLMNGKLAPRKLFNLNEV